LIKTAKAKGKNGPGMMDVLHPDPLGATAKANIPFLAAKSKSKSPTSVPLVAIVDGGDLRTASSTFWGGAFGSSIWDESTITNSGEEIRLAVPLPQLSLNIFQSPNDPFSQQASSPAATSLPIQPSRTGPKSDEPFILKRGAKRKSEAISEPESEGEDNEYDISFSGPSDSTAIQNKPRTSKFDHPGPLTKAEKKQIKRQRKLEKEKAAASGEASTEVSRPTSDAVEDEDEEEPFDYSRAESVLHAKRKNDGGGEGKKKKKQKPFDPYSKSENAAKGMRRAQTERAGKSHTFKN